MIFSGAYACISLDNARHNLRIVKNAVPYGVKIMCVVKANAYGHGAELLALEYERLGVDFFGVAALCEAENLRKAGIKLPILILGYTNPTCVGRLAEYGISQSVFSVDYANALAASARCAGVRIKIHIKIDTGMSRLGFRVRSSGELEQMRRAALAPEFIPEGIFTHFASADTADEDFTKRQSERFEYVTRRFSEDGLIRHAANSAAIIDYPDYAYDMVRAGIILYGISPSDSLRNRLDLRPLMTLKAPISQVKEIAFGETVGYSGKFTADRDMRIATVQIGYADGIFRSGSLGRMTLTLGGAFVKTLGNICMDQLMIELDGAGSVRMSDEVVVFGEGGRGVEDLARELDTIPYELTSAVGARVPRAYVKDGKIIEIKNNF